MAISNPVDEYDQEAADFLAHFRKLLPNSLETVAKSTSPAVRAAMSGSCTTKQLRPWILAAHPTNCMENRFRCRSVRLLRNAGEPAASAEPIRTSAGFSRLLS